MDEQKSKALMRECLEMRVAGLSDEEFRRYMVMWIVNLMHLIQPGNLNG